MTQSYVCYFQVSRFCLVHRRWSPMEINLMGLKLARSFVDPWMRLTINPRDQHHQEVH
ncbi:MAG TPA: hypothetical protein VGL91_20045 [Acidobacteriota bacterium]